MLGQRVRPARTGMLIGRAVSLACVVALCNRGAGGVAVEAGSGRSRSCRLIVRWPYMAGLKDSWAKACYFSDLAGGFGCSLEYPDPDRLLEPLHNGNMRVPPSNWSTYYVLPAPMAAEAPRSVKVLKTFVNKLPSRTAMERLSGMFPDIGGGDLEAGNGTTVAFVLTFKHSNTFWEKRWGVNRTQSIPEAVASTFNLPLHSKVEGGGHSGSGACGFNTESPAVKAYAHSNIQRLFNTTPFAVLILRRGDRARMFRKCSRAGNVARVFLNHIHKGKPPLPRAVFLVTNEHDPAYLRTLRDALAAHFDQIIGEDALMPLESPNNHFTFAAAFAIKDAAARSLWFHPKQMKLNDRELCPDGP